MARQIIRSKDPGDPGRDTDAPRRRPRLLLADDHQELLLKTKDLLASHFEIVGTARDGRELISAALELAPDVVVTDAKMPRLNGIEAGRQLLDRKIVSVVVLLTVHNDAELAKAALEAGIHGYVLKMNAGEELIFAIHEALQGRIFVSPDAHLQKDC